MVPGNKSAFSRSMHALRLREGVVQHPLQGHVQPVVAVSRTFHLGSGLLVSLESGIVLRQLGQINRQACIPCRASRRHEACLGLGFRAESSVEG